jgi:hypothetical protein
MLKKVAEKVSKNKKSKWYGLNPKIIQDIWACEGSRALQTRNLLS